jgi:parallel beta helix pectate lyase-like protein
LFGGDCENTCFIDLEEFCMSARSHLARAERESSHIRALACVALAAIALSIFNVAQALPVIPNLLGYGTDTPAGRGGKVIRVTNLNPSGSGSLKACTDSSGARVCVFEVSGIIRTHVDLVIRNPYLTIAGQTAPSPGISIVGGAIWIATHDVLLQHVRVRVGDDPDGPSYENRDALKLSSDSTDRVVVDHCSLAWAVDENIDMYSGWDNVTISNSIIAYGLHESFNPLGHAGYGLILGPRKGGHATVIGNLFANNEARNPLSRAENVVIVNNVVYNRGQADVDLQGENGVVTKTTVMGNVFLRGPDYKKGYRPVHIFVTGNLVPTSGSKIYVADNEAIETTSDAWSVTSTNLGDTIGADLRSGVLPAWPAGMTRLSTTGQTVLNTVLKLAGARPADRDAVDAKAVSSVRNNTGMIINCVSDDGSERCKRNAGGWPTATSKTRALTLPNNADTVTPSGYTNLELWLQKMSADVEGVPQTLPPPPVLAIK